MEQKSLSISGRYSHAPLIPSSSIPHDFLFRTTSRHFGLSIEMTRRLLSSLIIPPHHVLWSITDGNCVFACTYTDHVDLIIWYSSFFCPRCPSRDVVWCVVYPACPHWEVPCAQLRVGQNFDFGTIRMAMAYINTLHSWYKPSPPHLRASSLLGFDTHQRHFFKQISPCLPNTLQLLCPWLAPRRQHLNILWVLWPLMKSEKVPALSSHHGLLTPIFTSKASPSESPIRQTSYHS